MAIFTSNLPNDADMNRALGSAAVPVPLFIDCCFSGVGDNGSSLLVCGERKKVGDLAQCINDGRFLFQAQGCKEAGADVLVLILEGRYRRNPDDGVLEVPVWGVNGRGKRAEVWQAVLPSMQYSRFDQYLTELDYLAGIIVKRTENVRETADVILSLYQNFQTAPREHQSLKQMFKAPLPTVSLVRPSLVRRMSAELPGIGWERSKAVAEHFPSVLDMCLAEVKEWASLEGVGAKTARKVVGAIRGSLSSLDVQVADGYPAPTKRRDTCRSTN